MITKQCYVCNRILPLTEFTKATARIDGLQSKCRECASRLNKIWYQTPQGKAHNIKNSQNQRAKSLNQHNAKSLVAKRIYRHRWVRPDTCQVCGQRGRIEAHHAWGYDGVAKEMVQWLCKSCHVKAHQAIKACPPES